MKPKESYLLCHQKSDRWSRSVLQTHQEQEQSLPKVRGQGEAPWVTQALQWKHARGAAGRCHNEAEGNRNLCPSLVLSNDKCFFHVRIKQCRGRQHKQKTSVTWILHVRRVASTEELPRLPESVSTWKRRAPLAGQPRTGQEDEPIQRPDSCTLALPLPETAALVSSRSSALANPPPPSAERLSSVPEKRLRPAFRSWLPRLLAARPGARCPMNFSPLVYKIEIAVTNPIRMLWNTRVPWWFVAVRITVSK